MSNYEKCNICMQSIDPKILYTRCENSQREISCIGDDINPRVIKRYSIYDRKLHLCPLDTKLSHLESLYIAGYVNKVRMEDLGPIIFSEWQMTCWYGGTITVTTPLGKYKLLRPKKSYRTIMNGFNKRAFLSQKLVTFIKGYVNSNVNFVVLWEKCLKLKIFRGKKWRHIMRIVMKSIRCIHHEITKLRTEKEIEFVSNCFKWFFAKYGSKTSSTTSSTPVVKKTFEQLFSMYLQNGQSDVKCGLCEGCTVMDCGECKYCRDMVKFGGDGGTGKDCIQRNCSSCPPEFNASSIDDAILSYGGEPQENMDFMPNFTHTEQNVKWQGNPIYCEGENTYYGSVLLNGKHINIEDFVTVVPRNPTTPDLIVKIRYFWQVKSANNEVNALFHGQIYMRAHDTVLGAQGDPYEIYLTNDCTYDTPVKSIRALINVNEGYNFKPQRGENIFYNNMFYNRFYARFETLPFDPICPNYLIKHRHCPTCGRNSLSDQKNIPQLFNKIKVTRGTITKVEYGMISWKGVEFIKGQGVFLNPGAFSQTEDIYQDDGSVIESSKEHDSLRPELYRRTETTYKGSNDDTIAPFAVGCIDTIYATSESSLVNPLQVYLIVNVMYRPHNTRSCRFPQKIDINLVYWSEEQRVVPLVGVLGPCHLFYEQNLPPSVTANEASRLRWFEKDTRRFYFNEAYDKRKRETVQVPENAKQIGLSWPWQNKFKPMKCLDLYSGCGGLSEGLRQAGVADCQWAIDNDVSAALSYKMNHPNCIVYIEDCNTVLNRLISDKTFSLQGVSYPRRGQVELICGGPPCQGYSTMNRYNSSQNSINNNSHIATFLSLCEYYKPKCIIMENVRNFVAYKGGLVLKLTLRALLEMRYQCTFAVVQAGHYGVPQTRNRLIILATVPELALPLYPEPSYVFNQNAWHTSTIIDNKRFLYNYGWFSKSISAPRRTCTVEDAISDLPTLVNGSENYKVHAMLCASYYQKLMRNGNAMGPLTEHIHKKVSPLVDKRISLIPTKPGADWRCLPNVVETLSDGTNTAILKYSVYDNKSKSMSGVCPCVNGSKCSATSSQTNTLIPWCLVHTANRNNNWAGLYGRVDWCGYFSTTVTDPEPIGKQGRVLHPSEHRILSIRENARSQGIPDDYLLFGSMRDKYRQIGNAVPPPLAAAIGRELNKFGNYH